MKELVAINTDLHKQLRVRKAYGKEFGHALGCVAIIPDEIIEVQREYPILFRKNPETGRFLPVALLGFEEHENLFITDASTWAARYIPLGFSRGPFVIGSGSQEQLHVCFDRNDARVNQQDGELLFDESGAPSQYLHFVRNALLRLNDGEAAIAAMIDAFVAADLIEEVNMEVEFANGEAIQFKGAYTINAEKISNLTPEQIVNLNGEGFLALAYFIAGSVGNLRKLIEFKNSRI